MIGEARPKQGLFPLAKTASTIQYGYSKSGTHARVFSRTLAHWNSKNEIRRTNRRRRYVEQIWREVQRTQKKRSHEGLTIAQAYRPPEVATPRISRLIT